MKETTFTIRVTVHEFEGTAGAYATVIGLPWNGVHTVVWNDTAAGAVEGTLKRLGELVVEKTKAQEEVRS